MVLLGRGGGIGDLTNRVQGPPEDGQAAGKVEERTDLEDLAHGQRVDAEQDGAHGKVHGHTQEGHHSGAVLLGDRLRAEGADRGEVESSGRFEQQEGGNGVGGLFTEMGGGTNWNVRNSLQ